MYNTNANCQANNKNKKNLKNNNNKSNLLARVCFFCACRLCMECAVVCAEGLWWGGDCSRRSFLNAVLSSTAPVLVDRQAALLLPIACLVARTRTQVVSSAVCLVCGRMRAERCRPSCPLLTSNARRHFSSVQLLTWRDADRLCAAFWAIVREHLYRFFFLFVFLSPQFAFGVFLSAYYFVGFQFSDRSPATVRIVINELQLQLPMIIRLMRIAATC